MHLLDWHTLTNLGCVLCLLPPCYCLPQVVRMSPAEVFGVRQKVMALQQVLNKRAFAILQAFMPLVEDLPLAPALA